MVFDQKIMEITQITIDLHVFLKNEIWGFWEQNERIRDESEVPKIKEMVLVGFL